MAGACEAWCGVQKNAGEWGSQREMNRVMQCGADERTQQKLSVKGGKSDHAQGRGP